MNSSSGMPLGFSSDATTRTARAAPDGGSASAASIDRLQVVATAARTESWLRYPPALASLGSITSSLAASSASRARY